MSDCCIQTFNICILQGATYAKQFTWWGPVLVYGQVQQAPINLTGYTATLQIRPYALSTQVYYDASSNIVLGGIAGTITLTIPPSVTETFTWWNGVYDLLLTSADGSYSTRLFQGAVTVLPGVSA
jgi:hypothetical protein